MITSHGFPLIREAVFILVAVVFLDEEPGFNTPEMAGSQVTARMHIIPVERLVREPSVTRGLFDHFSAVRGDFFPAFLADDHMHFQVPLPLGQWIRRAVFDLVDPPELLAAVAPSVR